MLVIYVCSLVLLVIFCCVLVILLLDSRNSVYVVLCVGVLWK